MVDTLTIFREKFLTLTEATKLLPGRPNVATLWRWRTSGCRGIKLETVLIGGKRMVSREALQRFVEATTAAADGVNAKTQTPRQREAAINRAEKELDRLGV